ncbi:hybrid sensor histidine kinase/response regulator transcription factor [Fibrivirga algicola]|uniref:histidine kinase n=1 Tax=Fibrivirga algicola TaxID=2950420 RepID=A0ABX0QFG9_9BACT|nr:ATP-binding protein [Fibrivirga algicola]NID09832.1 response regulator [Fibrivirga algicola]
MSQLRVYTRHFLVVCILIACFWRTVASNAQPVPPIARYTAPPYVVQVRHFSVEEGLPNRTVTSTSQDAQGFVWIGTLNNAYRFDGSHFVPLPSLPRPSPGQLPIYIERMSTDKTGALWLFKARSNRDQWIERWNSDEKKLTPFTVRLPTATDGAHFLPADVIGKRGMSTTPATPLVIFQENGRVYFRNDKGKLIFLNPLSAPTRLSSVAVTSKGTMLVSQSDVNFTHPSLIELDSTGRVLRRSSMPKLLRPVCTDANGGIYLMHVVESTDKPAVLPRLTPHALTGFLYRLDTDGQLKSLPITFDKSPFRDLDASGTHPYSLKENQIVYDAHHDLFWFLGKGVVFAWQPEKGMIFDLAASGISVPKTPASFSGLRVDRTGGVWLASSDGILLFTLTPNRFARYLYHPPNTTGYSDAATRGIMQVGKQLWVNAFDSWVVDLTTNRRQLALPRQTVSQTDFLNQQPVALASEEALWVALNDLALVKPATRSIIAKYPLQGSANHCWSIKADGRGNLWLGFNHGISYFDVAQKKNLTFTRYNAWPELAANRVNGFFPDKQAGGMWVASSSGLYLLDTLKGIVARYSVEQPAPRNLPFNHITYVHVDPDQPGIYWLATRGGGLVRWERATGHYRQFTDADGLLNSTLYCLFTDHPNPDLRRDKNRLWFTTDYGLVSFNKKTEQLHTYLPKDGITHEEFNFTSNYQATDGRLYLGGLNGVTAFWPNQIEESSSTKAPLVVTQFQQLDGRTGNMTDYTADYRPNQPIQIASSSRSFLLSFALLDYRFLDQTRLWYRIRGWQDAWAPQKLTDLRINGLPPGSYELNVRIQNLNGQWVSDIVSIPLVVQKPIYYQWWFMLVCLLLLVGATVALFRWRNRLLVEETVRLEAEVAHRTARIERDKAIIEQQAAELRENATLKSRFFANVTHEFRTPLTLLLGPLTYLTKRSTDETAQRLLATMERNARQLQELVNDLLGLGKLEAGQLQLDSQPADLNVIVARTVAAFSTQASFVGIAIDTVGIDQPIGMLLDVPKFETVLRNLIANSLRFTPSGGIITIQVMDAADEIRLSVKDTGRGIHPDDLPHVIERYYQSNRANVPLQGGTGIGLAICHEYCQLWQGELHIDSQLGQGSTFTITYPKVPVYLPESTPDVPTTDAVQAGEPTALPIEPALSRERILIVEDNSDMAAYIQMLLAPQYAHTWCRNGREALAWLEGQSAEAIPQLIMTDMMMPEMDGMALLAQLRQRPQLRPIPVIMLTARFSQEVRLQALQLGVADYLTKPFDEDELLTRIQNLLDRAREREFWLNPSTDVALAEEPTEVEVSPLDNTWLQTIQSLVIANLTDSRFQVTDLADASNMSQRQFYRRLKATTGLSPIQFVQEVRLQTAHEWIEENRCKTVKEVAHRVGFQKVSYFSRLYQQRFGIYPSLRINEQNDTVTEPI